MYKKGVKWILLSAISLVALPTTLAIDAPANFNFRWNSLNEAMRRAGGFVYGLAQADQFVYGATFVLFFLMLFAIYAAALRKIKVFQNGDVLSKQGKILAFSLGMLSAFAIFWRSDPINALIAVLSPFGVLAGLLTAIVVFLVVFSGFKDELKEDAWKWALAAAGVAMIAAGAILSYNNIWWIGWALLLLGLFLGGLRAWNRPLENGGDEKEEKEKEKNADDDNDYPQDEYATLNGRVLRTPNPDGNREPVEGATVFLIKAGSGRPGTGEDADPKTISDEHGKFSLRVKKNAATYVDVAAVKGEDKGLHIDPYGHPNNAIELGDIKKSLSGIIVPLPRIGIPPSPPEKIRISGTVIEFDNAGHGTPVSDAEVYPTEGGSGGGLPKAKSDGDGRFEFEISKEAFDRLVVKAEKEGKTGLHTDTNGEPMHPIAVKDIEGGQYEGVIVPLAGGEEPPPENMTIKGKVVDVHDPDNIVPVKNANVAPFEKGTNANSNDIKDADINDKTDRHGEFTLSIPASSGLTKIIVHGQKKFITGKHTDTPHGNPAEAIPFEAGKISDGVVVPLNLKPPRRKILKITDVHTEIKDINGIRDLDIGFEIDADYPDELIDTQNLFWKLSMPKLSGNLKKAIESNSHASYFNTAGNLEDEPYDNFTEFPTPRRKALVCYKCTRNKKIHVHIPVSNDAIIAALDKMRKPKAEFKLKIEIALGNINNPIETKTYQADIHLEKNPDISSSNISASVNNQTVIDSSLREPFKQRDSAEEADIEESTEEELEMLDEEKKLIQALEKEVEQIKAKCEKAIERKQKFIEATAAEEATTEMITAIRKHKINISRLGNLADNALKLSDKTGKAIMRQTRSLEGVKKTLNSMVETSTKRSWQTSRNKYAQQILTALEKRNEYLKKIEDEEKNLQKMVQDIGKAFRKARNKLQNAVNKDNAKTKSNEAISALSELDENVENCLASITTIKRHLTEVHKYSKEMGLATRTRQLAEMTSG